MRIKILSRIIEKKKFKHSSKKAQVLTKATPHAGFGGFRWTIRRPNFSTCGQVCGTQTRTGLSTDR